MSITAEMVRDLREKTGAGILDCKKALTACDGDFEKAMEELRTKGLAKADKKASRVAADGLVHSYIHAGGRIGVLLEVNCETDFVARTDQFKDLVHDISMHIAATNPLALRREDLDQEAIAEERRLLIAEAKESGKPDNIIEKMVEGRIEKYIGENTLMEQEFVKDPDKKVADLVREAVATIGENIVVRRFVRFELGEGIEKKQDNLAAEVAAAVGEASA